MRIVHVQINQRPANFRRVVKILQPQRVRNYPLEVPAYELAVFAAGDRFPGEGEEALNPHHLPARYRLRLLMAQHDRVAGQLAAEQC